jgi:uncharacterized protein HemX
MIEFILLGVLFLIIVALSISGVFYVKGQAESVRKYVKAEIKKLVDAINDAQYSEFNFDKQNEQNIRKLEKKLLDVSTKVDSLMALD